MGRLRFLRGCTSVQSSSSSSIRFLGGLPWRFGDDDDEEEVVSEEVVFVVDFVLETAVVVFLGLPRFL